MATGSTETKRHIFISHSSLDNALGQRLCDWLESKGIPCWFSSRPANLDPGSEWDDSIVAALNKSVAVVLLFSEASNGSRWVKREMAMANTRSLPILPIRLDQSSPTGGMEAYLTTVQWTDLDQSNWEKSLERVVAQLKLYKSGAPLGDAARAAPATRVSSGVWQKAAQQMLIATVIGASLVISAYLAFREKTQPLAPLPTPLPSSVATPVPTQTPAPAPQTTTFQIKACLGEYERECNGHNKYFYCYQEAAANAWANSICTKAQVLDTTSKGGNKCGYTTITYLCTKELAR